MSSSLQDFFENWLPMNDREYGLKFFMLASVLWSLWTTRNKMAIEGVFPNDPADVLFKIHACLQKWRPRLGSAEKEQLNKLKVHVQGWVEAFLEERRKRPPENAFI